MTRPERIIRAAPPEQVTGRELVRAGDGRGLSLMERMGHHLHLMAWRTPLHAFRLRGRTPLRLLAVPKDPIAGNKAAGLALLDGMLVAGSDSTPIARLDPTDPSLPPQIVERLHSFSWLRDLAAAATHERGWKVAEQLTRIWLQAFADTVAEPAWRADLWGRRILFWTAYAPYILSSRDPEYRGRVLSAIARGGRHIERSGDKVAAGLPRIAAWCGGTAAALLVAGGAPKLGRCEAGLARAIRTGLHDDGGLISRSPIEQLALVELLGQMRATYSAAEHGLPDWVLEAQEGALSALLSVTLGDAGLSSWQAGNPDDPHRVVAAVEAAAAHSGALRQARGWGYQRVQARDSILVLDAAPPPSQRAFSGGCASTLAFELSDGPQRIVINCGGAGRAVGLLPDELAHLLRTTAAHSTLTLGDCNSTAIHADGSLGRGVQKVEMERHPVDGDHKVEASHDGYVRRFGLVHQRQLVLSGDGTLLTGQDSLIAERRRKSGDVPFAIRFHLAPGIEVTTTADGRGALLRVPGKRAGGWHFRCRGGTLAVEDSLWLDSDSMPRATVQLVVSGEAPADGMTIGWEFKKAG